MSTSAESFATVTARTQEAATTALRTWSDGLQTFAGSLSATDSALPDVKVMVKQYFDATQQVLDMQRRFTDALFSAADTARTVTQQTARATEHAVNATQAATNGLADLADNAGAQTRALARTAKNVTG